MRLALYNERVHSPSLLYPEVYNRSPLFADHMDCLSIAPVSHAIRSYTFQTR